LITIRRGARGGARVQLPSADVAARYAGLVLQHRGATLADVMDARVIVEAPAARMLAVRRDRASIARKLQAKLDSFTADDAAHFHEFNALVIELTGNETLLLLTTMLEHVSQAAAIKFDRLHPLHEPDSYALSKKAHRTRARLIELIRDGDADAAEELWREHLTEAGRVLTRGDGANVVDLFN
jgi:DNA-binding FadR family transcriptional regulator